MNTKRFFGLLYRPLEWADNVIFQLGTRLARVEAFVNDWLDIDLDNLDSPSRQEAIDYIVVHYKKVHDKEVAVDGFNTWTDEQLNDLADLLRTEEGVWN